MNNINIAYITDSNYIMQTYISILSLKSNKEGNSKYVIYIIGYNCNEKDFEDIVKLNDNSFEIQIVTKNTINIQDIHNEYVKNYSPAIFLKLQLEKILPQCEKVLFLDSDIIIKKDLSILYNTNIEQYYIAACKDIFPTIYHYSNGLLYKNYFNVGVLLLNLNLIRKNAFFEKAIDYYIQNGKDFMFPEQDTLNILIGKKIKLISPKYNYITSNKKFTKEQLMNFYELDSPSDIKEKNIVLFHYAGIKPWNFYPCFYSKHWEKYYKKSIFYNKSLKRNRYYNFVIRLFSFLKNQIRILKNIKFYKSIKIVGDKNE